MANTSLAGSPQETHASRIERGLMLFEQRGDEIRYVTPAGLWWVPSRSRGFYAVGLGPERCECAGYEHRGRPCEHIVATSIEGQEPDVLLLWAACAWAIHHRS